MSVFDGRHRLLEETHRLSTVVKNPRRTKTTIHEGAVRFGQENSDLVFADWTRSDPYLPKCWRELQHVYGFWFGIFVFSHDWSYPLKRSSWNTKESMEKPKQGEPTFPAPMIVGSDPSGYRAVNLPLIALDWILREEEVSLLFPIDGEISHWAKELWAKPFQLDPKDFPANSKTPISREVFGVLFADPGNEAAKRLAELLSSISSSDFQSLVTSILANDGPDFDAARSDMLHKLGAQITKELTPALAAAFAYLVAICRACRVSALCLLLHKMHITVLIARAERGDARAVLDLIKIDKLFLSDSCTAKVIRQAEFRNDRPFLTQLARAITYKPRLGWKKSCRLYLYMLFAMAVPPPALAILQHHMDPYGTRLKTCRAFERFFERCQEDFHKIQTDLLAENRQEPNPGNI